jgi:hypothetical protein
MKGYILSALTLFIMPAAFAQQFRGEALTMNLVF